jgi:hypothetical protein
MSLLKSKAIKLRKQGFSYSEIKKMGVNVSISSLSLWLGDIRLTKEQMARLNQKWKDKLVLGAPSRIKQRKERTEKIIYKAMMEIPVINNEKLWLMGIMLYWAEGSKQKEHLPSQTLVFTNSNPEMIRFYIKWLLLCVGISKKDLLFELYLHENHKKRKDGIIKYWSFVTGYQTDYFDKIYYKKDTKNRYRKNQSDSYKGLLRVKVRSSTNINRKVEGWIKGVCFQTKVCDPTGVRTQDFRDENPTS